MWTLDKRKTNEKGASREELNNPKNKMEYIT